MTKKMAIMSNQVVKMEELSTTSNENAESVVWSYCEPRKQIKNTERFKKEQHHQSW